MPGIRADLEALDPDPERQPRRLRPGARRGQRRGDRRAAARRGPRRRDRPRGRPPGRHRARRRARRVAPTVCSTPTTTCSRPATRPTGTARRSSRPSADGRLYGRGAADDKAGIMAHVAALRAHGGDAAGRRHGLRRGRGGDRLRLAWRRSSSGTARSCGPTRSCSPTPPTGRSASRPSRTTLRGMVRVVVDRHARSTTASTRGMFGGAVPDAHHRARARCSPRLHDDDGEVAVAGLKAGEAADLDFSEERLREESGLLDGVSTIGTGSLLSRIWTKPSITTIGIDAPSVGDLLQHAGAQRPPPRCRCGWRPTRTPREAFALLRARTCARTRRGASRSTCTSTTEGAGFSADAQGPVYDQARAAFPTPGACSRSTSASAGRSRSSPRSPSSSRRPRSSSPASRTPTRGLTAPTSRCTSASSRGLRGRGRAAGPARRAAALTADAAGPRTASPSGVLGRSVLAGLAGQGEHLVERDPGPARDLGSTMIWLTTRPCDQRLQRPDQVRQVDAVHRRAVADGLVQEDDLLVRGARRPAAGPG